MCHGDMVVVGDAGLPIPTGASSPLRIDLAVSPGVPSLDHVLGAVLSELQVELAYIAQESMKGGAQVKSAWCISPTAIPVEAISHDQLKLMCRDARAIVQTGECKPYVNIVLVAGVTFQGHRTTHWL
jgi:D-ribose pyranase